MGWASGFSAGTNLGKTLVNTYNQASQEDELRKIANEKPVESTGFTADQGAQLEAAAKTGQYDIGYDQEAKAYTVTPKSDPSKTGMVSMQGVTDFMGNRTAGRLDESQVNNAKLRAMAGVLGKTDPLQSTRLMREVTQGERDDKRFGWEAGGQENKSKMADLQLRALEDAEKTKNMQRAIVEAVSNGPGAVDDLFNNQYPDGFTSKSVVGPDGKWTIARMDKSGKVVAENKFNTSIDLIGSVLASADPAKFVERAEKKEEKAQTQANADRTFGLEEKKANTDAEYKRDLIRVYAQRADAAQAKASGAGKALKLDQDDLERVKSANSQVKRAEELVVQSMKDLQPGDDPAKMPGVVAAKRFLADAKLSQLKINVGLGTVSPAELANDVMGTAQNEAEVFKSLQQLQNAVGPQVAEEVATLVQNSDVWKQMVRKTAGANAAPSISGALAGGANPPVGRTGVPQTMTTLTAGDRQLQETAAKAGYTSTIGKDGAIYFRRADGEGPFVTDKQLTKMLNLGS